jgi:hypothetical protein
MFVALEKFMNWFSAVVRTSLARNLLTVLVVFVDVVVVVVVVEIITFPSFLDIFTLIAIVVLVFWGIAIDVKS